MSVTRSQIVAQARTWKGTPYEHQGRTKGVRVDCVGLLIGVAHELGLSSFDYLDYGQSPDGDMMTRLLSSHMRHLNSWKDALPGDVLHIAFSAKRRPQHLAIVVAPGRIIHAYSSHKKVVEHRLDDDWRLLIRDAYSFFEVN